MPRTAIKWTEYTWNPVTGCDRISAGCDNCYALSLAAKLKNQGSKRYQNDGDPRTSGPRFGLTLHPELLAQPYSWRKPRLVFVNSMSDLFHAKVPLEFVAELFKVVAETPQHTYQVLTKRAARLPKIADKLDWPANLWMGVTVENAAALSRLDALRATPAAVKFVSAEPLIGPLVDTVANPTGGASLDLSGIDQIITGGESGPNRRPIEADWVRDIRDAAVAADVAFFHKQWGGFRPGDGGNLLDGETWEQYPERALADVQ